MGAPGSWSEIDRTIVMHVVHYRRTTRTTRTTVDIADAVLDEARRAARERGSTLSRLVDDALRRELSAVDDPALPVEIPVFRGGSGLVPGVDLSSNRSIQELLDEGSTVDHLR